MNHTRKIIGFDTFQGFPSVHKGFDNAGTTVNTPGDLRGSTLDELELSIEKYNMERHLNHIPNVQLVAGDFTQTIEAFLTNNPHLIVALLYLDFDLYEPTKLALDKILPIMPKGAVVAFDELNCENFPGETTALSEIVGINKLSLRRFPFEPWISYAVL